MQQNLILIGLDGQNIIIFGGTADVNSTSLNPEDSLYVLNLNNFEWRIPKISGQIPKSRMKHKANVIGKYMVISFGKYILKCYLKLISLFPYFYLKIQSIFNRRRL